jgi:hypothetical protein
MLSLTTLLALIALGSPGKAPQESPFPTPGPEHALFKEWAGEFTFVNKFRFSPDMDWQEAKGSSVAKVDFDGFFLVSRDTSPDMLGKPFSGMGILGYDTLRKKYTMTWIDNFGPLMTTCEGGYDAAKKTLTMTGKMVDPGTGAEMDVTFITVHDSKDTQRFQMKMPGPDGTDFVKMEITYTRKT